MPSASLVVKPTPVNAERAWNRAASLESPVRVNARAATRVTSTALPRSRAAIRGEARVHPDPTGSDAGRAASLRPRRPASESSLATGARACSEPAIELDFARTDLFLLLDIEALDANVRRRFS